MKRYVQVGCGWRGVDMFAVPMVKHFREVATLCGVYDTNPKRAALVSKKAETPIPVYTNFDELLRACQPDTVIVTTIDSQHDTYVVKALRAGCDVICEKPLTTTPEKCLAIQKAQKETGKKVTVTFNLRFHPYFKRVKELVRSGLVGEIYSIDYQWMLDTRHGADYFRRWHRKRENSGSLLIHKSSHHFDIVNWLLEDAPVEVNAYGARRFYGTNGENRGERCLTCHHKDQCDFFLDIHTPDLKERYLECEDADGYIRDGCVFSPEIDIEDTVALSVRYSGGALMNYSLIAHSPYEGLRLVLNGSLGRLEFQKASSRKPNYNRETDNFIKFYSRSGEEIFFETEPTVKGGHGGADYALQKSLFCGHDPEPLGQMADLRAGILSIGVGMAANVSLAENRRVLLTEILKDEKEI
ncbi:MAG: Gfo/Idh/MocA family oxidoreductase [Clostridia bacterium]|nr:Gfo/Idh/MocA family oxidoreductase [Clostridia bacterium]